MPRRNKRKIFNKKKRNTKKQLYQRQYENNVGFKYSERNLKKNAILIGVKMK